MPAPYPADVDVSYYHREKLEAKGLMFAPPDIARRFSNEDDMMDSFGFHGKNSKKNMETAWKQLYQWERLKK